MTDWKSFPHSDDSHGFRADQLEDMWDDLHAGDQEPWPGPARMESLSETAPAAFPDDFDGDCSALADRLQSGWAAFHQGDFHAARTTGLACGLLGHVLVNKATGIYANHLEDDAGQAERLYRDVIERSEQAQSALPDDANAWYFHAFALGRLSQSLSVVKALKQGYGGKIQRSLDRTLELAPDHAEAHTGKGLYHAEIIDKVGKLIGGMTYGADADEALQHFQRALEIDPRAPVAHMEYGNGLYLLYGDKRIDDVTDAYIKASELPPRDAMEKLDQALAASELE